MRNAQAPAVAVAAPASVSGALPTRLRSINNDAYMVVFKKTEARLSCVSREEEKSLLYQNLSRDLSLFCHKKFGQPTRNVDKNTKRKQEYSHQRWE